MATWSVPRSDLLWAAALTGLGQVELVLAGDQVQGPRWAQHVGFALMTLPVAGQRVIPLPAVLVASVGLLVQTERAQRLWSPASWRSWSCSPRWAITRAVGTG